MGRDGNKFCPSTLSGKANYSLLQLVQSHPPPQLTVHPPVPTEVAIHFNRQRAAYFSSVEQKRQPRARELPEGRRLN